MLESDQAFPMSFAVFEEKSTKSSSPFELLSLLIVVNTDR
jgi:hypothetical protein